MNERKKILSSHGIFLISHDKGVDSLIRQCYILWKDTADIPIMVLMMIAPQMSRNEIVFISHSKKMKFFITLECSHSCGAGNAESSNPFSAFTYKQRNKPPKNTYETSDE